MHHRCGGVRLSSGGQAACPPALGVVRTKKRMYPRVHDLQLGSSLVIQRVRRELQAILPDDETLASSDPAVSAKLQRALTSRVGGELPQASVQVLVQL